MKKVLLMLVCVFTFLTSSVYAEKLVTLDYLYKDDGSLSITRSINLGDAISGTTAWKQFDGDTKESIIQNIENFCRELEGIHARLSLQMNNCVSSFDGVYFTTYWKDVNKSSIHHIKRQEDLFVEYFLSIYKPSIMLSALTSTLKVQNASEDTVNKDLKNQVDSKIDKSFEYKVVFPSSINFAEKGSIRGNRLYISDSHKLTKKFSYVGVKVKKPLVCEWCSQKGYKKGYEEGAFRSFLKKGIRDGSIAVEEGSININIKKLIDSDPELKTEEQRKKAWEDLEKKIEHGEILIEHDPVLEENTLKIPLLRGNILKMPLKKKTQYKTRKPRRTYRISNRKRYRSSQFQNRKVLKEPLQEVKSESKDVQRKSAGISRRQAVRAHILKKRMERNK